MSGTRERPHGTRGGCPGPDASNWAESRTFLRRGWHSPASHSEYVEGESLEDMIREDLVAERVAIDSYGEIIRYLGDRDPTTRRMLEGILAMEEEHAEDLASLLAQMG